MSSVDDNSANNPPAPVSPSKARPHRWRRYFSYACLAVVIYVGWWCWSVYGRWGNSKDPAEVRRLTERLCHIDIPPIFKPASAEGIMVPLGLFDLNPKKWGTFNGVQTVIYATDAEVKRDRYADTFILTEQICFGLNATAESEIRTMSMIPIEDPRLFGRHTEQRKLNINGEQVTFELIEGNQPFNIDEKVHKITGIFPGRKFHGAQSFIKLTCIIADERYDEAAFMRMLESIK